ncbi:MAG: hypothetical protein ACYDHU_03900 [Acidimicrobiales bacterium]
MTNATTTAGAGQTGGGQVTITWAVGTCTQTGTSTVTVTCAAPGGTWKVPAGVTSVSVDVEGGAGGSADGGTVPGGRGGSTTATLTVTPGSTYSVVVGGQGGNAVSRTGGGAGGFSGGGGGGDGAGGGGGRSEIDQGSTRLLVAGGGGGAGPVSGAKGGAGGGATGDAGGGATGGGQGGGGASQTGPGAGGSGTVTGSAGSGADGGTGTIGIAGASGGGGGGGYFGGGGGGSDVSLGTTVVAGGGGGGSGYVDPSIFGATTTTGTGPVGSGVVTITYAKHTACGSPVISSDHATVTCPVGTDYWLAPSPVSSVTVVVEGAGGGTGGDSSAVPGKGGKTTATLSVSPGQIYQVLVGGSGGDGAGTTPGTGGSNGGAPGGSGGLQAGGGGGGGSEIDLGSTRLVVAGGGGGAGGGSTGTAGGAGGGTSGGAGTNASSDSTGGGAGGTASAPGAGGVPGTLDCSGACVAGSIGSGASGGTGGAGPESGGGGGGGYNGGGGGGGGGAASSGGAGGGGGSGYADPSLTTSSTTVGAGQSGDGTVTITWILPAAPTYSQRAILTGATYGGDYGQSVAAAGTTVVVGDPSKNAAYIFEKGTGAWSGTRTEVAELKNPTPFHYPNPQFGFAVAISADGTTIAVSNVTRTKTGIGMIFVYYEPAGGWQNTPNTSSYSQYFTTTLGAYADGGYRNNMLGTQLALAPNGSWVAGLLNGTYSAGGADGTAGTIVGGLEVPESLAVFTTHGSTGLVTPHRVLSVDPTTQSVTDDLESLSTDGTTIVAGGGGSAFVWTTPLTCTPAAGGVCFENATLQGQTTYLQDRNFGASVAISSGTVVVGDPSASVTGVQFAGEAYVYEKPASGWSGTVAPSATLAPSDPVTSEVAIGLGFGASVGIAGDAIAVADPSATVGTSVQQGGVYVYEEPAGGWTDATENFRLATATGKSNEHLGKAAPWAIGTGAFFPSGPLTLFEDGSQVLAATGAPYRGGGGATTTSNNPVDLFTVEGALNVAKAGTGSGTVTGSGIDCGSTCTTSVWQGDSVTLTANPSAGSTFSGWSGRGCSGTGTCSLVVTATQTVTATFTLALGTPSVTFTSTAPSGAVVGGPTYTVAATTDSTASVTYQATTAACSVTGTTVTFAHAGTCVVKASVVETSDWLAGSAEQTISVGKGTPSVTFTSTAPSGAVVGGPTYKVAATTDSTASVTYQATTAACSVAGTTVTFAHAGTCVVKASVVETSDWLAGSAEQTISVGAAPSTTPPSTTPPSTTPPSTTPPSTRPPTVSGYWDVASDGGIFAFGSATFYGSMGGRHLNAPVVGIAAAPTGKGYWEVASDGGIFAFGSATFHGSMGGQHLNAPVVGMAAAPTAKGYWEVASDGGIIAFGSATFHGSMGGQHLNAPVVGIAAAPTGKGYWEVASDGGIFAFGSATFSGSMGGQHLNQPIVGTTVS